MVSDAVGASVPDKASPAPGHDGHKPQGFLALVMGSIGVVFGDIGTSPLYAMREALHHTRTGVDTELAVLGVVSLVIWALILVVTLKYVVLLMRADNKGEGGTLALMALARRTLRSERRLRHRLIGCCLCGGRNAQRLPRVGKLRHRHPAVVHQQFFDADAIHGRQLDR